MILVASLLVHEYGHALTAMYFGAKPEINLEAFGGNAQYNNEKITPFQSFIIILNGPLFESLLNDNKQKTLNFKRCMAYAEAQLHKVFFHVKQYSWYSNCRTKLSSI